MVGREVLQLAALLLPPTVAVAVLFARLAPEPYMDEPFHVPQTQRFCEGHWGEWDPKITTFPGLYFFGVAVVRLEAAALAILAGLFKHPSGAASPDLLPTPRQLCSTTALRSVNLIFAAACLPLFYAAARRLDPGRSRAQLMLMTAAAFLFPLHYFYTFLYYTDVPSLFFTLAAYLAAQCRRYCLAGGLGAIAVLMRQTNAVWVAFTLAAAAIERCLPEGSGAGSKGSSTAKQQQQLQQQQILKTKNKAWKGDGEPGSSGAGSGGSAGAQGTSSSGSCSPDQLLAALPWELVRLAQQAWLLKWQLLVDLWPLAAVVAAFATFVVVNGGIVVGDKEHHAAVHHLVQPLYCLLYCTAWLAPVLWTRGALCRAGSQLDAALQRHPAATAAVVVGATAAAVGAVRGFTMAHPFLLADNRHYTFYLWRRLVNRTPWARYALIPAYLYSAWVLADRLGHRRPSWAAVLAGASSAVLVPAHLVEFRYFTVPFYLIFLHMRTPSPRALGAVVAFFATANAATLYLFLARPFTWPDGSIARFLW